MALWHSNGTVNSIQWFGGSHLELWVSIFPFFSTLNGELKFPNHLIDIKYREEWDDDLDCWPCGFLRRFEMKTCLELQVFWRS